MILILIILFSIAAISLSACVFIINEYKYKSLYIIIFIVGWYSLGAFTASLYWYNYLKSIGAL